MAKAIYFIYIVLYIQIIAFQIQNLAFKIQIIAFNLNKSHNFGLKKCLTTYTAYILKIGEKFFKKLEMGK